MAPKQLALQASVPKPVNTKDKLARELAYPVARRARPVSAIVRRPGVNLAHIYTAHPAPRTRACESWIEIYRDRRRNGARSRAGTRKGVRGGSLQISPSAAANSSTARPSGERIARVLRSWVSFSSFANTRGTSSTTNNELLYSSS